MATAIKNCIIISDDGKIIKKKDICPYCGWSTTGSYVAYAEQNKVRLIDGNEFAQMLIDIGLVDVDKAFGI